MRLDEIAIVTRAIGAALVTFGDSIGRDLAQAAANAPRMAPEPVSAPPQGEASRAAPEPADGNVETGTLAAFEAGLRQALAEAGMAAPQVQRRRRKPKPLYDEHDRLVPDWTDQGEGFLCQRRAALALRISRAQLLKLEGEDRLLRSVSDDGRRIGYPVSQLEHLLAAVARAQERMDDTTTTTTTTPPTDDDGAIDSES